ncbi:relaxase/mobilization nuclease domain-containing protein [Dysosmobacter sp.]|uniref:relaxase/mobilization nuclease domain-containing protein n=1 Tax=Dysosmobacter sp. TaxID=2591382 RepID=UPI00307B58E2
MAIVHFVNYKRGTQSRAAMHGVMLYVMQEMKTTWEGAPLVSGINCQVQSVYDDFLNTKLLYHKDGGVMFYHMVQSFPKGTAVDPRQAHEAARRLAEYFDGCEVLVCTHVDREHIHSHCVINSVNFETGKKLHMAKEQLQELMRRNDAICLEMGLPVFDVPTQQARGMGGAEYHTALRGQSWKLRLMNTIDECMKYAADKDAFVSLMASEGYAVRWESGRKYITYTTPDGLKCRDSKLHEEKYCKEAMEHEFRIRAEIVSARTQAAQRPADRTSDADTTSRSVSLENGLGANDEIHECTVVPCGSADGSVGERQQADVAASHTDAAGRSAKDGAASGADDRTGWETEREVFLQVDRLAAGLQPAGSPQVDRTACGDRHGDTGGLVWRGGDPQPVPLIPAAAGLAAAGTLLDEDEDAEEKRRRMEAKIAAENFGAAIGFAAGAALAVKEKLDEHAAREGQKGNQHEQTMGGL